MTEQIFKLLNPVKPLADLLLLTRNATDSWISTICLSAGLIKLSLLPLAKSIKEYEISSKTHKNYVSNKQDFIQKLKVAKMEKRAEEELQKLNFFMHINKCHPISIFRSFIPLPFYMTLFLGFNNIVESMRNGTLSTESFLWIANIAQPDPILVLPFLCSGTIFTLMKLNKTQIKDNSSFLKNYLPYIITSLSFPIFMNMNSVKRFFVFLDFVNLLYHFEYIFNISKHHF